VSVPASTFRFRVLVVEDDPNWREIFALVAKDHARTMDVRCVASAAEAREALTREFHHFVSIDQSIPDRTGEVVVADNGLLLCETIVRRYPLTGRAIYTAHGRSRYANIAGKLDGTEYYEKKVATGQSDALDVDEYFQQIERHLAADYIPWALERAARHLPLALGAPALELGNAWRESSVERPRQVSEALFRLWERSVWLAWAQTLAIAYRAQQRNWLPEGANVTEEISNVFLTLRNLWPALGDPWLSQWRPYLEAGASPGGELGRPLMDAWLQIRGIRNQATHAGLQPDSTTLSELRIPVLRMLGSLAFWAQAPLISAPRYSEVNRSEITALQLAGAPPWSSCSVDAAYTLPKDRRGEHVFVPWRGRTGRFLLDLFPFVSLGRGLDGQLEPQLLRPQRGRGSTRLSLVSYRELPGRNIDTDERQAIQDLFGNRWSV
jgi:CheY-like chemotaxis protein